MEEKKYLLSQQQGEGFFQPFPAGAEVAAELSARFAGGKGENKKPAIPSHVLVKMNSLPTPTATPGSPGVPWVRVGSGVRAAGGRTSSWGGHGSSSRERGHCQALLPWQLKGFPEEKALFRFLAGTNPAAGKEPRVRDQPRVRNVGTAGPGADPTQDEQDLMHGRQKRNELNALEKWEVQGSNSAGTCL